MTGPSVILRVVAVIVFILATLGVGPRVPMTPLGLALWCASTLLPASSGWRSYLK